MRFEIDLDLAAAIRPEHAFHLCRKAFEGICGVFVALPPGNLRGAMRSGQLIERRLGHPAKRADREAPALVAALLHQFLQLRIDVLDGIAHPFGRSARHAEPVHDVGKGNAVGRALHQQGKPQEILMSPVT